MDGLAKIGDKVRFRLLSSNYLYGDLLYIPAATGDSWVIQSYYEGKKDSIMYIQQFEWMAIVT